MFSARPRAVRDILAKCASDISEMKSLTINGRALAKKRGAVPADKVRTIVPLPAVLSVLDCLLARRVNSIADRYADAHCQGSPAPFLECARHHRQVMDAVHPLALAIELGLDDASRSCVAQEDIKKYYDSLAPLRLARWIEQTTGERDVATTLVLLHTGPLVVLSAGGQHACMRGRTRGLHTGSRSASALGRLPPLDVAAARQHAWKERGLCGTGLASFVENLVCAAPWARDALYIMNDAATHLHRRWGLAIGEDSRELMIARGGICDADLGDVAGGDGRWTLKTSLKVLGHVLQDNGGINECYAKVTAAMQRCLFANLAQGLRRATPAGRARFLDGCVLAVGRARFARWPWQRALAAELDTFQRAAIASAEGLRPEAGEDWARYSERRAATTRRLATSAGAWSRAWASSVTTWNQHLVRGHDPGAWTPTLLTASRTQTVRRTTSGRPRTRWREGLEAALSLETQPTTS